MLDTPTILETHAQLTAIVHLTIPREEIQHAMRPAMQEVMAAVTDQGLAAVGPMFSHHLRMDPEVFDFEVGVPVDRPVSRTGRVQAGGLPATTAAKTVYTGPFEGLGEAWGEFGDWIVAQGRTAAPDLWECYAVGPQSNPDPATWRTELVRPLEPR